MCSDERLVLEHGKHFDARPTVARIRELMRIAEQAPPTSPMARAVRDALACVAESIVARDAAEAALAQSRVSVLSSIVDSVAAWVTR